MRGKIRYCRELQKSYVIAEQCRKDMTENYCGQMVLKNRIKGLAECEMRLIDGQREMWYDISSLQTLEQAFAVKEMGYQDLKNLLLQVIWVINEAEKYLLDGRQLCFEPEYVYLDMENEKIRFLFDLTEVNEKSSLPNLAEFILERTCHEEENAAELAYYFYDCAGREEIPIKELENHLEEREETDQGKACKKQDEEERETAQPEISLSEEITGKEMADRALREDKGSESPSLWNGRCGRLIEGGFVCIIMALLSGAGFFAAGNYFILEDGEKMVWAAVSFLLCAAGISICVRGFAGRRKENREYENKAVSLREREEESPRREADLWEEEMRAEFSSEKNEEDKPGQTDGRTIYIGKSLLQREYRLVRSGKGAEEEHLISSYPFLVGKDKERVNLPVKEHSVSRIHARLLEENGDIYVEDLHSTNGTYLNDLFLEPHEKVKLKRGDILQFGKAEFIFR